MWLKKNNSYFLLASWVDDNLAEMYYVRHISALIIKGEYAKCKMRRYFLASTKIFFNRLSNEIIRVLQENDVTCRRGPSLCEIIARFSPSSVCGTFHRHRGKWRNFVIQMVKWGVESRHKDKKLFCRWICWFYSRI